MPVGLAKVDALPTPFALPELLLPARVETAPVATMMERMILLPESATKTRPDPSTATPVGLPKEALLPTPFALPQLPLPARVETAPVATTMERMR